MLILTLRTDKPEAEIGFYNNQEQLAYMMWQAHRELSNTVLTVIQDELIKLQKNWDEIEGLVFYKGPGSFTGLRIGASVANALAAGNQIPIVATMQNDWIKAGINLLLEGKNEKGALPEYGAPAHTTTPRK